jgi:hypothetical protein
LYVSQSPSDANVLSQLGPRVTPPSPGPVFRNGA